MKISLSGLALASLGFIATAQAAEQQVERSVAADARGSVIISNVTGRVEVQGWARAEVQVSGRLGAAVERLDVLKDGNNTIVKVVLPRVSISGRSGDAQLTVRVPFASRTEVSTVSADQVLTGVQGAQALRSVSGDISSEIAAETEIKTVSGDLTLRGNGQAAPLRVSTVSGDLRLMHAAGAVEIVTVSGDMTLDVKPMTSLRVRTTSGDMHVESRLARDARVDIESVSGDVFLDGPADAGFTTEANSFSGDISTCFGARSERDSEYGPGTRLRATVGAGSARLRIKTLSGDVSICDK